MFLRKKRGFMETAGMITTVYAITALIIIFITFFIVSSIIGNQADKKGNVEINDEYARVYSVLSALDSYENVAYIEDRLSKRKDIDLVTMFKNITLFYNDRLDHFRSRGASLFNEAEYETINIEGDYAYYYVNGKQRKVDVDSNAIKIPEQYSDVVMPVENGFLRIVLRYY